MGNHPRRRDSRKPPDAETQPEPPLEPGATVLLAVREPLSTPDGKPMVWYTDPQETEERPLLEQPTLGTFLLACLRNYTPPGDNPAFVVVVRRIEEKIVKHVEAGTPYTVGQLVLQTLQEAWRISMRRTVDQRPDNGLMAQVAVALQLKPAPSDLDMTGLEDE